MRLAQGPQLSDAGEARTRGLSVSSQALYHWAPLYYILYDYSCDNWSSNVGKTFNQNYGL